MPGSVTPTTCPETGRCDPPPARSRRTRDLRIRETTPRQGDDRPVGLQQGPREHRQQKPLPPPRRRTSLAPRMPLAGDFIKEAKMKPRPRFRSGYLACRAVAGSLLPTRGSPPFVLREARDLLELRSRSLDPLAAELAAQRRTSSDPQAIRAAHEGLEPLTATPSSEHLAAHRASSTPPSIEPVTTTSSSRRSMPCGDRADRYRQLAPADRSHPSRSDRKRAEHLVLIDHIASGDHAAAAAVMRAHRHQPRCHSGPTPGTTAG